MRVHQTKLENSLSHYKQRTKKLKQLGQVVEQERELDILAAKIGSAEIFADQYRRVKAHAAKLKLELSSHSFSEVIVISDDEDNDNENNEEEDEDSMQIDSPKREESVSFQPSTTLASTRSRRPVSPSPSESRGSPSPSEDRESPSPSEYRGSPVKSNQDSKRPGAKQRRTLPRLTVQQLRDISAWKVQTGSDRYEWKEVCKTLPSLQGMKPKLVGLSFTNKKSNTLRKGKPWPY